MTIKTTSVTIRKTGFITAAAQCVNPKDLRPYLRGVHIAPNAADPAQIVLEASNGHVALRLRAPGSFTTGDTLPSGVIIPLHKALTKKTDKATQSGVTLVIRHETNESGQLLRYAITAEFNDATINIRDMADAPGPFPPLWRVIPDAFGVDNADGFAAASYDPNVIAPTLAAGDLLTRSLRDDIGRKSFVCFTPVPGATTRTAMGFLLSVNVPGADTAQPIGHGAIMPLHKLKDDTNPQCRADTEAMLSAMARTCNKPTDSDHGDTRQAA